MEAVCRCLADYVAVAQQKHQSEFDLRVSDIKRALGDGASVRLVSLCEFLKDSSLLEKVRLRLIAAQGPPSALATVYRYKVGGSNAE